MTCSLEELECVVDKNCAHQEGSFHWQKLFNSYLYSQFFSVCLIKIGAIHVLFTWLCVFRMAKIVPVKLPEPVITSGEEEEAEEDSYQPSWQGSHWPKNNMISIDTEVLWYLYMQQYVTTCDYMLHCHYLGYL